MIDTNQTKLLLCAIFFPISHHVEVCPAYLFSLKNRFSNGHILSEHLLKMTNVDFSYVSSKNLGQSRQSHTGCICFTFPHCVFSNVSSNRLPEKRHNHIGCICLTFLHCAFLNVSSNRMPEWMHSHIGCICSTFLHCVFSNVFSN